jgi:hypothetical protein
LVLVGLVAHQETPPMEAILFLIFTQQPVVVKAAITLLELLITALMAARVVVLPMGHRELFPAAQEIHRRLLHHKEMLAVHKQVAV